MLHAALQAIVYNTIICYNMCCQYFFSLYMACCMLYGYFLAHQNYTLVDCSWQHLKFSIFLDPFEVLPSHAPPTPYLHCTYCLRISIPIIHWSLMGYVGSKSANSYLVASGTASSQNWM